MHPRGHSSRKKSSARQATEVTDADGKPDDAVNRCENKLAVICGTVSSEMTSTMPTMRRHATMVSAMNIISTYSKISTGIFCERAKLTVKGNIYDRADKQIKESGQYECQYAEHP